MIADEKLQYLRQITDKNILHVGELYYRIVK